eukprot:2300112-Amphidinium_carterae.1
MAVDIMDLGAERGDGTRHQEAHDCLVKQETRDGIPVRHAVESKHEPRGCPGSRIPARHEGTVEQQNHLGTCESSLMQLGNSSRSCQWTFRAVCSQNSVTCSH